MYKTPDLTDANEVLTYGSQAQARVAEFSQIALENLKARDLGEVSDTLHALVATLEEPSDRTLLGKLPRTARALRAKYGRVLRTVDRIACALQEQRDLLMRDVETLGILYEMNREQYGELTEYLQRGREALERHRRAIPRSGTGDASAAEAIRDARDQADRFERKLHDLEVTRAVSLQMAPQIRLLQNNNTALAEKIQSSLLNTIPLWKSQMTLALGSEHSRAAAQLQEKISQVTDALLLNNAKTLKQTVRAGASAAERETVRLETLRQTNALLLETFDELHALREKGRRDRLQAERELHRMEEEIRVRLIGSSTPEIIPPLCENFPK